LHQSAKDGFRSYLQSYASYSLKKIFDVNNLDLSKVGKAFGFSVPPRVNVALGGNVVSEKSGKKRRRGDEDHSEDDVNAVDGPDQEQEKARAYKNARREKEKRIETMGKRMVEKEVYRKGGIQKSGGAQWSR
jgi:ATP-dependent RNA helicase DDX18/HAS1